MFELRPPLESEHPWLVELHNDPLVLQNLTHPTPITLESHMAWWKKINCTWSEERLVFTKDDVPVGFTKFYSIDRVNRNCVLGADIHADFRGKGLALPMWQLMLKHCFEDLNMHRVSLTTAAYNTIGQRVYRKAGFQVEGKLIQSLFRDGKFHDQICMCMFQSDWV